jgi:hypothetical protein
MLSVALRHGVSLEAVRRTVKRNADGTPVSAFGSAFDHLYPKS